MALNGWGTTLEFCDRQLCFLCPFLVHLAAKSPVSDNKYTPSPPIDNIWAMMFVWKQEGRLSELFCVVLCTETVHSHKYT